jgi:glycosyltransferase involved in cell wall biosynthesis
MPFTTFIIPTIGRDSLPRTIDSLLAQDDPDFECLLVYDGISPTFMTPDKRFQTMRTPMKLGVHEGNNVGQNFAGKVRNFGIERVATNWISFVDDDDTVTSDYVRRLKEAQENDVVIFKMNHPQLGILPPKGCQEIINGQVGISFSVRKSVLDKYHIRFMNDGIEDYNLLMTLQFHKAKIYFSPYITYKVRH